MPRRVLYFCLAIVAAFQIRAAAAPVEDIPVPPSVMALAERLGVDLVNNRAYFINDMARLLYVSGDSKPPVLMPARAAGAGAESPPVSVPMPMPAAVWSRAIFRRPVAPADLAVAILSDRDRKSTRLNSSHLGIS